MGKKATCVADEGLVSRPDQEVIEFARGANAVLVTADGRIKVRKHERAALQTAGISVVEFVFPDGYSLWERFQLAVNKWLEIEAKLQTTGYVVVRPRSVKSLSEDSRR